MDPINRPEFPHQWAARCECYNGHNSSSGRCNARDVMDPNAAPGAAIMCERCRETCRKPKAGA